MTPVPTLIKTIMMEPAIVSRTRIAAGLMPSLRSNVRPRAAKFIVNLFGSRDGKPLQRNLGDGARKDGARVNRIYSTSYEFCLDAHRAGETVICVPLRWID